MKSKRFFIVACALMVVFAFEACKRVVDVESLKKSFTASVVAEQMESGNTLTIDTIILNPTTGDNFKGELRGHINDSTEVVYDLDVADEGKELTLEWNLRE